MSMFRGIRSTDYEQKGDDDVHDRFVVRKYEECMRVGLRTAKVGFGEEPI